MSKTKVCKKCGFAMDKSAKACPQCGAPAKGKTGWIIGGVVAAIILIPMIANGSDSDTATETSTATASTVSVAEESSTAEASVSENESAAEQTKAESSESKEESKQESKEEVKEESKAESKEEVKEEAPNNTYKVGETLDTGSIKITFQSAEDYTSDNMFIEPDDGNKYIRAYFVVENTGKTDTMIGSYSFDCYADDSAADSPLLSDKLLSTTTLSPGRKTEGYVYFEVPQNAQKIEIEYETSLWTQKKAIFVVK